VKNQLFKSSRGTSETIFYDRIDFDESTYSSGELSFEVQTERKSKPETLKRSLQKERDEFFAALHANVLQSQPEAGGIIDNWQAFNLELVPPVSDQAYYFSKVNERLKRIYKHFCDKTVVSYHHSSGLAATFQHQRLIARDYSLINFETSFRHMLPVMFDCGELIRGQSGVARIYSFGSHSFTVEQDEKEVFSDSYGQVLNVKYTHAACWARILREYTSMEPVFCDIVRMMLTYQDNNAGPERVFSQLNHIKSVHRAVMKNCILNDMLHLRINTLPRKSADYVRVARELSSHLGLPFDNVVRAVYPEMRLVDPPPALHLDFSQCGADLLISCEDIEETTHLVVS